LKVLLLGAGGMLARDLIREAPGAHDIVGRDIDDLDITDPLAVSSAVRNIQPDLIVNAAAYTNVDGAESEPDLAFAVNGDAPGFIGAAAKALGVPVVHYSTDYVFDGSSREPYGEDESTSPIGVYGASKLQGEQRLAESGAASLIIRTQWLFGIAGPSFPQTMWKRATGGETTRVVDDQTGRPTYTVDLARATWGSLGQPEAAWGSLGRPGAEIVHMANSGTATWYDLAKRVFEAAGRPELLEPCSSVEYPTPARRPAWSVLSTERYEATAGEPLPRWGDALDRFLRELQEESSSR
jgi:dTDP-4-dehydrorhamnose reductase